MLKVVCLGLLVFAAVTSVVMGQIRTDTTGFRRKTTAETPLRATWCPPHAECRIPGFLADEGFVDIDVIQLDTELGVTYWTTNDNTVPVCWETAGYDREKVIVRDAVEGSWQFWANVDFTGWGPCPMSGTAWFVRVAIESHGAEDGGVDGWALLGTSAATYPDQPAKVHFSFQAEFADRGRVEYIAVHEFGHVLGFGHEQDAPGNEGPAKCTAGITVGAEAVPITAYDPDSIMNYCNRDDNMSGYLSDTDISGVQEIYGVRRANVPSLNLCGSARTEGTASLASVWHDQNSAAVAAFPADGTKILSPHLPDMPEGGWGDAVRWVAGDFDGNGLTDLGAVRNDSGRATLTVRLAQPERPAVAAQWMADLGEWADDSSYLAGDFNGDGMSDIASARSEESSASITVFLGEGDRVSGSTYWGEDHGGWGSDAKWMAGDFDGDGMTDVGAAWNNDGLSTLTVWQSTGPGSTAKLWREGADRWFDAAVFLPGDFDGDGMTDVAQIWNDLGSNSIRVYRSDGEAFGTAEAWATRIGDFPPSATWIPGDFDGDRKTDIAAMWQTGGDIVLRLLVPEGARFVTTPWAETSATWLPATAWCAGAFQTAP